MTYNEQDCQDRIKMLEFGLTFFGAISASISHELNNVLSIINQTAGLLQDLLYSSRQGKPIPEEKLSLIAEKINTQSDRGVAIIKRFNTFAHNLDDPLKEFDLNAVILNFISVINRLANQKKIKLIPKLTVSPLNIVSNPFLIQLSLYYLLKKILLQNTGGGEVEISSHQNEAGITVQIKCPENLSGSIQSDENILQTLMKNIAAEYEFKTENNYFFYLFKLIRNIDS